MLSWLFSRKGASGFSWSSTAEAARPGDARGPRRYGRPERRRRRGRAGGCPRPGARRQAGSYGARPRLHGLGAHLRLGLHRKGPPPQHPGVHANSNNAGVMATPFSLSKDGIEMQFATNHVGHFLLIHLVLETMKKTSCESNVEGRIVNVSSEGHRIAYREGIRFAKINDESEYNSIGAYGQSKLANISHANELARRFKEEGVNITANSLHPGSTITNLLRHHSILDVLHRTLGKLVLKNAQQGAATTCYVALHPQVKGVSGWYFCDSNLYEPSEKAKNMDLAKRLWELSIELIT